MVEPYKFGNINLNKIIYSKPKQSGNKKVILIKYNDNNKVKNLVFQTPTLYNLVEPDIKNGYGEIEVALFGKEKNRTDKFINFLQDIETKVKKDAQLNAHSWFDINENNNINFQKIIRDIDGIDTGILKLKVIKNNDFETILNINKKTRIEIGDIKSDIWCKMLLEFYAIWINPNNDFGIFLRPILINFTLPEKQIYDYKMIEESDEEQDPEFDIPDTEVDNSIFMKIETKQKENNETTSILEVDNLVNLELSDSNFSSSSSSSNSLS